jgi:hypothetical protein
MPVATVSDLTNWLYADVVIISSVLYSRAGGKN